MTGATGLVGSAVRSRLIARGDTVTALTRRAREPQSGTEWQIGQTTRPSDWMATLDGCDA
ncbi:MAG: NAD-dependent epimerase/dehydratase family protein, partial [Myxococcota bacterium]